MRHPNRRARQVRQRSKLLRDSLALMSLAGYPADQPSVDDISYAHLAIPSVLAAFRIATQIEARYARAALARSGTLQKYDKIVRRLAVAHRLSDPYAEYRRRQKADIWTSKSAREEARSALSRHATDQVIGLTSLYLQLILAALPLKADRRTVLRVHRMLINRRLMQTPALLGDSWFPLESCTELARASRFLTEQKKATHPLTAVAVTLCSKQKRGKRPVLVALHRHQSHMRKAVQGYDWRDRFWHQVRRDQYIDEAGMACVAALMITGCRPGEFAGEHSMLVSAEDSDAGQILCCTITGAKIFRSTQPDAVQLAIVTPGKTDHPSDPDRGQPWRRLTIACLAPEALWLHEYARRHGATETGVINKGEAGTTASRLCLTLHDPTTEKTGHWLHPSERSRRAVLACGKTTQRIGKAAFPKLKEAVTPYVFRHALATDLRVSSTHSREEIAQALGHLSMRSMSAYGTRGTAKPGVRLHAVIDIAAPLSPRPRRDSHQRRRKDPQFEGH